MPTTEDNGRGYTAHISETPDLRWFKPYAACRMCGKKSDGILMSVRNESYGDHCKKCADKRLKGSERARAAIAKAVSP